MGMDPERKEIPAALLARLLERPDDPAWVDGLLFVLEGNVVKWSAAASRSALGDEELARRFTFPGLTFSAEQRRTLGRYEYGRTRDWEPDVDDQFLQYKKAVSSDATVPQLTGLLDEAGDDFYHRAVRQPLARPHGAGEPAWLGSQETTTAVGEPVERRPLATDLVCYGIGSYRTAEEMAEAWRTIERNITRHPDLIERVVTKFADELRYYYGCFARGSGELYLVW